ncbi:MAG: hypothetical protein RM022_018455 [Nostoc sp. EfeVER01]|uniref:hypothetical protein n=1 Tax=unclassified Nostoc TaxID=2593658 RepID=UPI002AD1F12F|nr:MULTISPECIES: hypothetical protein [unclassified Nostoc]MDZ7944219.1 hypothetical protein [Nostoc sp. EfeVER01]MDZ7994921.1 hypothetical protein [Nostoc sp. EspVER01]
MVLFVASGTSLKTANTFEVMHILVMTLNMSEFSEIVSVLSRLYQQQLELLIVVAKQSNITDNITPESICICQALAQKTEKTRGNASIDSFEVEHQIFIERQLLKSQWLLARAIVRKATTGKYTHFIEVYEEDLDLYRKSNRIMQINTPKYHIIMTEMLNDVLIIGQLEVGKLECKATSFNLVEHSQQSPEQIQMNLGYRRLIFFTSQYKFVTCCIDEKLLVHILTNLFSNAIKYFSFDGIFKFNLLIQDRQTAFEVKNLQDWDFPRMYSVFN